MYLVISSSYPSLNLFSLSFGRVLSQIKELKVVSRGLMPIAFSGYLLLKMINVLYEKGGSFKIAFCL